MVNAATNGFPVLPPGIPTSSSRGLFAFLSASPTAARTMRPSGNLTAARTPGNRISSRALCRSSESAFSSKLKAGWQQVSAISAAHRIIVCLNAQCIRNENNPERRNSDGHPEWRFVRRSVAVFDFHDFIESELQFDWTNYAPIGAREHDERLWKF